MRLARFFLFFFPVILIGESNPPPVPPAGIVERQIEQEYEVQKIDPEKQVPLLEIDIPEKKLDLGRGSLHLKKVVFEGNDVFSSKVLERKAKDYVGRDITMQDVQEICAKVQRKYNRRGYFLTRVYPPAQVIKDGVLKLTVIEGHLGDIIVTGNEHYSEKFIRRYLKRFQGKAIQYDHILKALFLLDENRDLEVGAVLKKGKTFGTADLIVRVQDKAPIHLVLDHNNYGSDHTPTQRTGARFDAGNIFTYGDMLTVIEVVGSPVTGLNFTDIIYHVPVNAYGGSLDLSYLLAQFKTDRIDDVRFKGISHIATAKFDQALQRTRRLSTDFFASFDYKQIQNFTSDVRTSFDKLRVLTGGMKLDYVDSLRGRNLITALVAGGLPDILGGSDATDPESSREGSGGQFFRFNATAKRLQKLPYDCFLLLNGVGQYAFEKLPLPEQIYIGGIDTVRGYPLAVGLGDYGFYATAELHVPPPFLRDHKIGWMKKRWGDFLQFVGFLDHGQTFVFGHELIREGTKTPSGKIKESDAEHPGRVILTSAGAGVRLYGPWNLEASFDVGFPLTKRHKTSNSIVYFRVAWNVL
ncbi:MAG: ShlB/FhaC/HecB family hemolysin secretion/activation protein [Verrucomicrobia bacterium]|nr:ShlB/FhaC/HecB family hemolysin secretion/activation protein [Verrucomicrobiota bacterium]